MALSPNSLEYLLRPQTSGLQAHHYRGTDKERAIQKARPERAPPPPVTVQVPGAAYLAGLVPAWANVPFKADGLDSKILRVFQPLFKKEMGLWNECVVLPGSAAWKKPRLLCWVTPCSFLC